MPRLPLYRLGALLCGLVPAFLLAACGEEPAPPRLTGFTPAVLSVPANEPLEISASAEPRRRSNQREVSATSGAKLAEVPSRPTKSPCARQNNARLGASPAAMKPAPKARAGVQAPGGTRPAAARTAHSTAEAAVSA